MIGKSFFLSIFLYITFFQFSECEKIDKKTTCYVDKDFDKNCEFNPDDRDSPDLSKCKEQECEYGCGRTWVGSGKEGVSKKAKGTEGGFSARRKRNAAVETFSGMLSTIKLGCKNKGVKDSCATMTKKKGICVCYTKLCNSASNIVPATFIILLLWTFAVMR